MLGCTCQAVRGLPTFAPCLENICAGGGGDVMSRRIVMVARGSM